MIFKNWSQIELDGVSSAVESVDSGFRLLKPITVLFQKDEAIWRLLYQVILIAWLWAGGLLVHVSQYFKSASQVSLFDFVGSILIVFIWELVNDGLPLLKKLRWAGNERSWELFVVTRSSEVGHSSSDLARLKLLLRNGQHIEHFDHAFDNLNGWKRVIRVLNNPHFQKSAALHLEKDVLNVFLFQQLLNLVDHFESMHGSCTLFDAVIILYAGSVHPFDETQSHIFAFFIKVFLVFDAHVSPVWQIVRSSS